LPGPLVHFGAQVMCMHGGLAQPSAPFPRVLVSGQPVVTLACPWVVAGCGLTSAGSPCVTGQFVTAATRIFAGGAPLILQDSQAVCVSNGTGLLTLVAQTRAVGI